MDKTGIHYDQVCASMGNVYRLKGKLSRWKEVNMTFLPETDIPWVHISDIKQPFEGGKINKAKSKSVSINMDEAEALWSILSGLKQQFLLMSPVSTF